MEITVKCQHCGQDFESDGLERTIFCPHCGVETPIFESPPTAPRASGAAPSPVTRDPRGHPYPNRLKPIPAQIRSKADVISGIALVLVIFGTLMLIAIMAVDNPITIGRLSTYGRWFIEIGIGTFLIAQIVHIRANTHRDE